MARARSVFLTANFDRNLVGIREFLAGVIPQLQRFPEIGADFLSRAPLSAEGRALFEDVAKAVGREAELRQWIDGDYLVLYLVKGGSIYLLSIKHQRQVSFDFAGHWP